MATKTLCSHGSQGTAIPRFWLAGLTFTLLVNCTPIPAVAVTLKTIHRDARLARVTILVPEQPVDGEGPIALNPTSESDAQLYQKALRGVLEAVGFTVVTRDGDQHDLVVRYLIITHSERDSDRLLVVLHEDRELERIPMTEASGRYTSDVDASEAVQEASHLHVVPSRVVDLRYQTFMFASAAPRIISSPVIAVVIRPLIEEEPYRVPRRFEP